MNVRRLCLLVALGFAFISAAPTAAQSDKAAPTAAQSDKALASLAERYWDAAMERYPTRATGLGDFRFNDRLEDVSEQGRKRWRSTLNGLLKELRQLPDGELSASDRLTRDLLERVMMDELLRMQSLEHYRALDPLYGAAHPFPADSRFAAFSQPRGLPRLCGEA